MSNDETALELPPQSIPVPKSISPQGQAYLAAAASRVAVQAGTGKTSQSDSVTEGASQALEFLRPLAAGFQGSIEIIDLPGDAKLYRVTPESRLGRRAEVAYLDIHGGGFITGGGEMCRLLAVLRAMEYGTEVFAVDYRLMPQHPYPAALDDCVAAYRQVLSQYSASDLVVGGSSAGGNLAAALMLRARDERLPPPAALLLLTPAVDITLSGDSCQTNRYLDVNLYGGGSELAQYAGKEDPTTAYVSPLFGEFTAAWPPTFLMTGTRDLLLSDTVRMHRALRRAGVAAELHVNEASPHGGFMGAGAPEDAEIMAECRRFTLCAWGIEDHPSSS
ncbi:alpha/beta hydrolase [Aestuariicella hydrocarbonica]|uniref:Alpha/beta hydrolase n=1 Tax=Pseudomaricurvus hydrocarbonicus TaxID=1470433 RepID=A0A9E5T3U0_9GAMM|nr:alpha/beta hydrolase fold domain-containing protein [Aestuariicella hydrocarbonica]NHO67458.1 alpha/beta hydrolase [Aestuariicella hydrocarbonica]